MQVTFVGAEKSVKATLHLSTKVLWCIIIGFLLFAHEEYEVWESVKAVIYGLGRLNVTYETRNTFCGTWYLPHSHVHN